MTRLEKSTTQDQAFAALAAHFREVTALGQVAGLLGWDQETMMPPGAAAQRAEWRAALASALHERRTDPRVGDWLAQVDPSALAEPERAMLRLIRRQYERHTRVPGKLAAELARVTSEAHVIWARARAADDFSMFRDALARVLDLRREEAAAIAGEGQSLYEALLQDYEPGLGEVELAEMLGRLRAPLVELRREIAESGRVLPDLEGRFSTEQQLLLARELATAFGYDWSRGRLDLAVHPFSSGSGDDVRITTRVVETDPFNCFYSTIHETGHATYEQNVNPAFRLTPLGRGASMGVHESQSRIYENQLGRSRAFCGHLYRRMVAVFGDFGVPDADTFYAIVNKLHAGYIRTEADEVQYNLHIILRFELERQLISGALEVDALEEAWNAAFEAAFGYPVDRPSNGVLQDVHWSEGLFGYFPTYTLGNIYAGELYARLRAAVPDLDAALAGGDARPAVAWLAETVHRHGALHDPRDLMTMVLGHPPGPEPLVAYLREKFGALYELS